MSSITRSTSGEYSDLQPAELWLPQFSAASIVETAETSQSSSDLFPQGVDTSQSSSELIWDSVPIEDRHLSDLYRKKKSTRDSSSPPLFAPWFASSNNLQAPEPKRVKSLSKPVHESANTQSMTRYQSKNVLPVQEKSAPEGVEESSTSVHLNHNVHLDDKSSLAGMPRVTRSRLDPTSAGITGLSVVDAVGASDQPNQAKSLIVDRRIKRIDRGHYLSISVPIVNTQFDIAVGPAGDRFSEPHSSSQPPPRLSPPVMIRGLERVASCPLPGIPSQLQVSAGYFQSSPNTMHSTDHSEVKSLSLVEGTKFNFINVSKGGEESLSAQTVPVLKAIRKKVLENAKGFALETQIVERVSSLKLGPAFFQCDRDQGIYYIECVDHLPWASFEDNPGSYRIALEQLKKFHSIRVGNIQKRINTAVAEQSISDMIPFSIITSNFSKLNESAVPELLKHQVKLICELGQNLITQSNLENGTIGLCHGDFHKGNALHVNPGHVSPASSSSTSLSAGVAEKVYLIDFTDSGPGLIFFDLVKFSLGLETPVAEKLFTWYLGRSPTKEETQQYQCLSAALSITVALIRFKSSFTDTFAKKDMFTKKQMENVLENDLPGFLSVPYKAESPKQKQYAALCALKESVKQIKDINRQFIASK